MRNKDLIRPVRTRGAIRTRGSELEGTTPSSVRTRGAIQTRGTIPSPTLKVEHALTLDALVKELREQVGDLPLVVLVHGGTSKPAQEFIAVLLPRLQEKDALWVVPAQTTTQGPMSLETKGIALDFTHDVDQRTYNNLVGDIVFFSALEASEVERAIEWKQRARAVIVHGQGPQSDAILRAGCEAGLMTYRWSGGNTLEEMI